MRYVAVSHIWHPQLSDLQYQGAEAHVSIDNVARILWEDPVRIYLGLAENLTGAFEIWHDYVSVPQWQRDVKGQIIQSIPRIFNQAHMTLIHLSDVNARDVNAMRRGTSVYETCRGMSNICNSKWFSRVWTAMEFTQSRNLRVMLEDFSLMEVNASFESFIQELLKLWGIESLKLGDVATTAEEIVGMGNNLVPWQLGPLQTIRDLSQSGVRTSFGMAHELLTRRCVTIPRDFFHGLLGSLETDLTEPQLDVDFCMAMSQIARDRIKDGDYSPLLMVPASSLSDPDEYDIQSFGYHDLVPFAMGPEQKPPTFSTATFRAQTVVIKVENIGDVRFIRRLSERQGTIASLSVLIRLTLDTMGDDVEEFIKTMGRLYALESEKIFEHLSVNGRSHQLQEKLRVLYDSDLPVPSDVTSWIAETMGFTSDVLPKRMDIFTPLVFQNLHGGTLHLGAAAALASVSCPGCHKKFILRVALLKHESHLLGAKAYRIPGLKYQFTLAGGAGLIVKDGRKLARFLWGVPTCQCSIIEEVEILLDDLPLPQPNRFQYGKLDKKGWYPLRVQNRINLV